MHKIVTQGSYYEMGETIGKFFRNLDKSYFLPDFSKEKLEASLEYLAPIKQYTPDLLDEFKGISDTSDIDFDTIVAKEISPWRVQPQCLVMAIASKHNILKKPILAKNHEWVEEDAQYLTVSSCKPDGKIESFGFTFRGSETSKYGGINRSGLAISSAAASFNNPGIGIIFNIATRWILDNCNNTDEAVKFLKKIPKVWGVTYIIIDKNDNIAKVESHSDKTIVTGYDNNFAFNTLAFDSEEMKDFNENDDSIQFVLSQRKNFINNWFNSTKGSIELHKISNVLKDHENKVCDHSTDGKYHYGICWSWILTIGSNQSLISEGPPCKNEFQQIDYFNQ